MDKATLVTVDVGLGQEVVEALDKAGAQTNLALWLHSPEYGDWRLVISLFTKRCRAREFPWSALHRF